MDVPVGLDFPTWTLLRDHAPELLVGALIPLASFALFHLVTVFPISWITLFTDRSAGEFLMVQCSGALICAGGVMSAPPPRWPARVHRAAARR